jgi:hypothetical protein
MNNQIKFNKYNVTDGTTKARVHYGLDNRTDGKSCVTIREKDYEKNLRILFPELYKNDTDMQTDYFEHGRVNLFEDHPLYKIARDHVEKIIQSRVSK